MNKQEAFDKVWQHFVVNKMPKSWDGKKVCRYRGNTTASDPVRCAAGVLLPDELYKPEMDLEGPGLIGNPASVIIVVKQAFGVSSGEDAAHELFEFVRAMQTSHDNSDADADFTAEITQRLTIVAGEYKLQIPNESTL